MPTLDALSKLVSQPTLDPDDPSYALSPKSHDDPRNPLRQPKHRSHEDQKDDQEVQCHTPKFSFWVVNRKH
jgi:hypothetical protein